MSQTVSDKGWIYCITSEENKANNVYKIGMTTKIDLEEEIRKHLLHRYGTSYPNPEIVFLNRVSFPRKVEKLILEALVDHKEKREIVKADYISVIQPILQNITQQYPHNNPVYIDEEVYRKYVLKLEKNMVKLVKEALKGGATLQRHMSDYLYPYFHNRILTSSNSSTLCNLYNEINGTNAPIISTHDTYTEQQKIIRKNWENDKLSNLRYSVAHWDKTDPNIHKFLKDFSKIC